MDPVEPERDLDERDLGALQRQMSADVKCIKTKEDFEQVLAIWEPIVRAPMSLESLLMMGELRGWI